MENSYRFYRNTACQYFPCHEYSNLEEFNCMFCYCPLFLMEDCGGNNKNTNGVKDCSDCLVPHNPKGYDHINKKLMDVIMEMREDYIKKQESEKEDLESK